MKDMEINSIRSFLNDDGTIHTCPSKYSKRLTVMQYIAEKLDVDKLYTEKELNEFLNSIALWGDPCTLRRELYNARIIGRKRDGSEYWKEPKRSAIIP